MGFGEIMKKSFPFIQAAAAAGGPFTSIAANAVGSVFGLSKPPTSAEEIGKLVSKATPEQMLALKQEDNAVKVRLAELGYHTVEELERIAMEDRKSAREREIAVKDNTPRIIAYTVVGAFCTMAALVLFKQVAADSVLTGTIIGYLSSKADQAISYYLGSSHGSETKNAILAKVTGMLG